MKDNQRKTEKKEKKRKPARLKTQKGGLGKSQGQRKEEKMVRSQQIENLKMYSKKKRILQDESEEL